MIGSRAKAGLSKSTVMSGALILIAAIAGYNWAVAPHLNYLQAAERYGATREELSLKGECLEDAVAARKKELEELEARYGRTRENVFDRPAATAFFNGVQAMAENAGCAMSSLTFLSAGSGSASGRSAKNAGLEVRRACLSVLGDYGQIVELVDELQNRSQQVSIESIGLRISQAHQGKLECNMTIVIWVSHGPEEGSND